LPRSEPPDHLADDADHADYADHADRADRADGSDRTELVRLRCLVDKLVRQQDALTRTVDQLLRAHLGGCSGCASSGD
jgi:hypothetical protein